MLVGPLTDENGELIIYDDDEDESPLYDMVNERLYDPYRVLKEIFGEDYKNIINDYLNFE